MPILFIFFFFNVTATTEIYTLSLHDALPISCATADRGPRGGAAGTANDRADRIRDRKSTRLNSSHEWISYAVFCLKKKKAVAHDTPLVDCQGQHVNSL